MKITPRDKQIFKFIEERKGLSIEMAANIFYKGHKFAYDESRRRLKKLYDNQFISRYTSQTTGEYIYYFKGTPQLSDHDFCTLKFYSKLISYGATVNIFTTEKVWGTKKRSDGFFEFVYNNELYLICLEIDFTHMTSIPNKYVPLFESREIQDLYKDIQPDMFPKVIIMTFKDTENISTDYPFPVTFINFEMDDFVEKVLL